MTFTQIFEGYAPIEQVTARPGPSTSAIGIDFKPSGESVSTPSLATRRPRTQADPQPSAAEIGAGRYDPGCCCA
jgi:hypothetical protein